MKGFHYIGLTPKKILWRRWDKNQWESAEESIPLVAIDASANKILATGDGAKIYFGRELEQIYVCNPLQTIPMMFEDEFITVACIKHAVVKMQRSLLDKLVFPRLIIHPFDYGYEMRRLDLRVLKDFGMQAGARDIATISLPHYPTAEQWSQMCVALPMIMKAPSKMLPQPAPKSHIVRFVL